jgi:hypothetical protein
MSPQRAWQRLYRGGQLSGRRGACTRRAGRARSGARRAARCGRMLRRWRHRPRVPPLRSRGRPHDGPGRSRGTRRRDPGPGRRARRSVRRAAGRAAWAAA